MGKFETYRADVERRDRRYLWMRRTAATLGAASLAWLAVWSAGLDHSLLNCIKSRSISARVVALSRPRANATLSPPRVLGESHAQTFGGLRSSVWKTSEQLVLTGTMPGRNSHEGLAFIGIDARHPQTYSAGALMANGARLMAIFRRYVVLQKGERQARLYLGGGKDRNGRNSGNPVLMVGGRQTYTPAVANAKEEFTDFIRETPIYDGVTVRGFQVYPGKQESVFARMGLHAGDLIVSVDGEPLSDPAEAVAVFRQLAAGTSESAEVIRDGKSTTVTLDGSLIVGEQEREREAATGSPPAVMPSTY